MLMMDFAFLSGSELPQLFWMLQPQLALHIPDGFLSLPVSLMSWLIAIGFLVVALNRVQADYQEKAVPLMGVCAAFIFAAQMINFPIIGGTSGHLLGGTLAGVLLGPWAGALVVTIVFAVQALIFQDGGITALGANVVNMGLVGTFLGYYLYRTLRWTLGRDRLGSTLVSTGVAAWMSVFVAAILAAFQLAWSGTVPLQVAVSAMAFWHVFIGLGEALITIAAVSFVWRTRPDLLYDPPRRAIAASRRSLMPR